jgi:hypothetical protein
MEVKHLGGKSSVGDQSSIVERFLAAVAEEEILGMFTRNKTLLQKKHSASGTKRCFDTAEVRSSNLRGPILTEFDGASLFKNVN